MDNISKEVKMKMDKNRSSKEIKKDKKTNEAQNTENRRMEDETRKSSPKNAK